MIIDGKKLGESFRMILDDRITKEEAQKLKEGDSSVIKQLGLATKEIVAAELLENYNGYLLEDSDGMIHVMSIGAIIRNQSSDLADHIKGLDPIDFNGEE